VGEGTVTLFFVAAVGIAIGAALTPAWRRHRARMAKARRAGEFIPRIDARGLWLVLNGPATLALGLVALGVGGWNAKVELAEQRRRAELFDLELRCEAEHVTFELLGREPRRVDVRLARVLIGDGEGSTVRLSPRGTIALEPGAPRTLDARLVQEGSCGQASPFYVGLTEPRGAWPDCDGMRFTFVIRDASGEERATGERDCTLSGRSVRLPNLFGE